MNINLRFFRLYFSLARHDPTKYPSTSITKALGCSTINIQLTTYSTKAVPEITTTKYKIKYPSPGSYKTDKRLMAMIDVEKPPVVVLFGWAGSLDKHVEKYSKIYEDRGFITLNYSNNTKKEFWKRKHLKEVGERFVKLVHEVDFHSHPIIFHCFSNSGVYSYRTCTIALEECSKPLQVKGIIFDSSPAEQGNVSAFKTTSYIVGGKIWYNIPVSSMGLALWYYDVYKNFLLGDKIQLDPIQWLKKQDNISPQFFVYSKSDMLVRYQDVEAFMDFRKNLGVDVSSLRFEDSPHVQHYVHHRNEYIQGVCDFLAKCLKPNN